MAPAVTAPAFTVLDLPVGERTLIGLAHVSTDAQNAQLQHDALTEAYRLLSSGARDWAVLERQVQDVLRRHPGGADVPRPWRWGGFRVLPGHVEFWQESPDGLHDRLRYRREGGGWIIERLSP